MSDREKSASRSERETARGRHLQEINKKWEERRRKRSLSRRSSSDINTDGSEAGDSDYEYASRGRSRRDVYLANQPRPRMNRSMSQSTGMDRSEEVESIVHGLSSIQYLAAANSTESFSSASSNDEQSTEEKRISNFLKLTMKVFGDRIAKMMEKDKSHSKDKARSRPKGQQFRKRRFSTCSLPPDLQTISEEQETVDLYSLQQKHESVSSNLEAMARNQEEGRRRSNDKGNLSSRKFKTNSSSQSLSNIGGGDRPRSQGATPPNVKFQPFSQMGGMFQRRSSEQAFVQPEYLRNTNSDVEHRTVQAKAFGSTQSLHAISGDKTHPNFELLDVSPSNSLPELSSNYYELPPNSKGVVVIFNYIFREQKAPWYRINADRDSEKIEACFKRLGFDVILKEDRSKQKTLIDIQSIIKKQLENKHSLFFFFLSHGENKGRDSYFFTSDKRVITVPEIWDLLTDSKCKIMMGKPKVLILSYSQPDRETMIPKDDSGWLRTIILGSREKYLKKIEAPSDLATIQATMPNIEVPEIEEGTVFPSCFCDTLLEQGKGKDLHEIVYMTGERLNNLKIDSTPSLDTVQFRKFMF